MPDWKALFSSLGERFKALSNAKKGLLLGGVILVFAVIGLTSRFAGKAGVQALLYQSPLSPQDYAKVTSRLQEMNVKFDTKNDQYVLVGDPETAKKVRMQLGQGGIIPQNVRGWELFDVQRFTTTDFERDVNLQRAIIGEMTKHIKTLADIEDVSIQVTFPDKTLYSSAQTEPTASVVLTPSPYSDIAENKGKISGIVNLVAFGIPNLKSANIVVVDNAGNVLSDLLVPNDGDERLRIAREQLRVMERERARYTARVTEALRPSLPQDRFLVSADIEFDWNKRTSTSKELIPTVIRPDNPLTPYDDSEVVLEVTVSDDRTTERYRGPSYIPEGPAGVEDNVPPGLKDKIDRFNQYERDQTTRNLTTGTRESQEEKAPYEIKRVSVSVAIDGVWTIERDSKGQEVLSNGSVLRTYAPVDTAELRSFQEIVQGAVGYNAARLDQVFVRPLRFDRSAEFAAADAAIRRRILIQRLIIAGLLSLIAIIVITIAFRIIMTQMELRRQRKEEELLRQQAEIREAAMRRAEAEKSGLELSMEERASNELLESVINTVREHPQETAKLIRTWLVEGL